MKSTALAKFSATKVGFVFNLLSSLVRYFPVFTNIPIIPELRAPSMSSNASFKNEKYIKDLIYLCFILFKILHLRSLNILPVVH